MAERRVCKSVSMSCGVEKGRVCQALIFYSFTSLKRSFILIWENIQKDRRKSYFTIVPAGTVGLYCPWHYVCGGKTCSSTVYLYTMRWW